jgi:hypothetical protein
LQPRIKKIVLQQPAIRRVLTGFLLALFALSITPQLFLHSLVASHTDNHIRATGPNANVAKATPDCDCENQVAESPFEYSGNAIPEFTIPVVFLTHQYIILPFLHSESGHVAGLRGPPQA